MTLTPKTIPTEAVRAYIAETYAPLYDLCAETLDADELDAVFDHALDAAVNDAICGLGRAMYRAKTRSGANGLPTVKARLELVERDAHGNIRNCLGIYDNLDLALAFQLIDNVDDILEEGAFYVELDETAIVHNLRNLGLVEWHGEQFVLTYYGEDVAAYAKARREREQTQTP